MKDLMGVLDKLMQGAPVPSPNWWEGEQLDRSELVRLISSLDRLSCFDNQIHQLGTNGRSFNHEEFACALTGRARQVGAQQTVQEVDDYLGATRLDLQYAALLARIHVETAFVFANDVRLEPVTDLIDCSAKTILLERGTSILFTSALVADYRVEKRHYSNIANGPGLTHVEWPPFDMLTDTQHLLSLARSGGFGVAREACATLVPDALSFIEPGAGWAPASEPTTHMSPELIELELRNADRLIGLFSALDATTQDRLRIVLRRLNDAKIDPDFVNKAINLRICVENLFVVQDDKAYITSQITARMPALTNLSKNRAGKIYGFLSGPVHTGRLPNHATLTIDEVIAAVRQSAICVLEEGAYRAWPTIQAKT